jgi:aminomethyltransferase
MANRTPLYDWHVARGARIVDFAGWDMPIQYSTIIEEHTTVRTGAGLFDISHMGRLSFGGPDSLALLQHVYTNNAATMQDGQVRYGLVCNEQGGIRDDVLVYKWPYGYAMVVNASNRPKIVEWLHQQRGSRQVQVDDQTTTTAMIAIQGPQAVAMSGGLTEADASKLPYYHATPTRYRDKGCVVSRTGYTGEDGLEFMVPAALAVPLWEDLLGRGAKPCGLGARDTLRLEAAMPLYGHELSEEIDPFQAGLAWAVKMDKGDFLGRSALERRRKDENLPVRVGLEMQGKRLAREGADIRHKDAVVGRVCSGTFAPTLQKAIAMAYVARKAAAPGTALDVDIRGKVEAARVVPLPFYKRTSRGP